MTAVCLADLFNLDLWSRGRIPTYADVRDGILELVDASLKAISVAGHPQPTELLLRFYGAWLGPSLDDPAPLRDVAAAVIGSLRGGGRPRLRFQLADSPIWDPSIRLLRSARSSPLKPPAYSLAAPSTCPHQGACSVTLLTSWFRKGCPDAACSVTLGQLGTIQRQKMVDTLLTADALALAHNGRANLLLLASDDDDMIPALLALSVSTVPTIHLRRKATLDGYYAGILTLKGLPTITW